MHPFVREAFSALDAGAVAWALLRGFDDASGTAGDIDLLVAPSDAARLEGILGAVGFERLPARGHGEHRFYISYDPDADAWLNLDVMTDVAFGRLQQFHANVAESLLARRRREAAVATLARDDAFWHLLLHELLGKGAVAARRMDVLGSGVPRSSAAGPLERHVRSLEPRLAPSLVAAVHAGDWDAVSRLGVALRHAWWRRHLADVAFRTVVHWTARHLPVARPGVSVAILGPDGAGKTTLAEAVRASIPIPSRYVYLGIWRQTRFEMRLRRILGARLAIRLMKLLWKSVLIRYHRMVGRVVLLDRYTCDADLPAPDLDWKGRLSARLVRKTCADPDLMLLLDGPVELMFARKGEHGVRELQLRRDAYLAMADRFPQMVVLDARQPAADVRRRATALLWQRWASAT